MSFQNVSIGNLKMKNTKMSPPECIYRGPDQKGILFYWIPDQAGHDKQEPQSVI